MRTRKLSNDNVVLPRDIGLLIPFRESIGLLRDLADLQNGAPLEQHRKEWEETMGHVYDFLNKWEDSLYGKRTPSAHSLQKILESKHIPLPIKEVLEELIENSRYEFTEEKSAAYKKVAEIVLDRISQGC